VIWKVKYFIVTTLVFITGIVKAQVMQTVKGRVTGNAHQPLAGANVILLSGTEKFVLTTDSSGVFSSQVPAQRYIFQVRYVGYATYEQELLVTGGKMISLTVQLEETSNELAGIEVTAKGMQSSPGVIDIPIEKALRLPASYFDPLRAAISYPGVVQASDQANSLVIRGASPSGILWRLNGLDILNPNHLSNAGTLSDKPVSSGGGVNMLSAQMLDNTRLITTTASANYGNYTAGVMDMNFREANNNSHEFTAQASLLGLDVAAEGPVTNNSSYLVNYRYSTIGLLSQAGVDFGDEQINFQDLSFQLSFNRKKSTTKIFGVGGLSRNEFDAKEPQDIEVEKDVFTIDYESKGFTAGATTEILFNKSVLSAGAAFSYRDQDRQADAQYLIFLGAIDNRYTLKERLLSTFVSWQWRPATPVSITVGTMFNFGERELTSDEIFLISDIISISVGFQNTVKSSLLQPYANVEYSFSPNTSMEAGARYQVTIDSAVATIDPRVALKHRYKNNQWTLSYGIASQFLNLTSRFTNTQPVRVHQLNLAYDKLLPNEWQIRSQVYGHFQQDFPASTATNSSLINYFDGEVPTNLLNNSQGRIVGGEITLEKKFEKNWYVLAGTSVYDAKYKIEDGDWTNSRFNGGYTVNLSSGKEWNRKKEKVFGVHVRALGLGGLRTTPITINNGQPEEDVTRAFQEKLGDYFRLDARLVWRKNKPGFTRSISLDIQNVLSIENDGFQYYDRFQQRVLIQKQLGIIPILAYRVDF
jgi:hypothetical protein